MKFRIQLMGQALLFCGLIGCGGDTGDDTTATSSSPSSESVISVTEPEKEDPAEENLGAAPEIFQQSWNGDLDIMEDRRVIRVLTIYSIGRYYLDGPQEKGLVYEMFKRFEDAVNKSLQRGHLRVHVLFVPVARSQLIPALNAGYGDIIAAGLTITPERSTEVDFSTPISKPVSEILVTGPAAAPLATIDDLSGQTVYVRHSSSYRESVETLNSRFAQQGREPVRIESLSELLEDDDLIEMVNAGLLPWAIVDDYKTQLWDGVFDKLVVRDDIVFRSDARLGFAFRKNSPKLEAQLNKFLKTHRQGTLVGNVLNNRYLRDFDWASNALAQEELAKFKGLQHIFEKYGEQYGLDYLMIAAQGFQESRLSQKARSNAGAIGVMQLLPATARDSNVGIKNIHEVDPNIHAGVKYLDFLRDRYFSDPEIDDLNRTLLALAAYNAGPSRMINLRNQAIREGKDPNVWFDNVEVIAAKEVGRETVQYVANIYKYYLSYQFSLSQQMSRQAAREKAGI
ncbi:MAG: transporter substrate-binding domain-containing protein [Halioglobus sp.]